MNTPKPHPPVSEAKRDDVAEANKATLAQPKPKARPKPKAPYTPKNQPLKEHPGLIALKNNLEKR